MFSTVSWNSSVQFIIILFVRVHICIYGITREYLLKKFSLIFKQAIWTTKPLITRVGIKENSNVCQAKDGNEENCWIKVTQGFFETDGNCLEPYTGQKVQLIITFSSYKVIPIKLKYNIL